MKRVLPYLCLLSALLTLPALAKKPNFIIIFTDDQGYQDLGCFGAPEIKTPNIDGMAEKGGRFTDFYVPSPVCSPSRAAILTGCYPKRIGMENHVLFPHDSKGLNPKEVTLAEVLKKQGYATACFGKWHLGHKIPFLPTHQGFDEYFGIPYSNDMLIDPTAKVSTDCHWRKGMNLEKMRQSKPKPHWVPLMRGEEVIEYPADQSTLTQRYTAEALQFIKKHKDEPFFIYLAQSMPHLPLAASKQFTGKSKGGPYGDAIEEIDWSVGEILKTLKQYKLDQDTIVVFTSDNGPWLSHKKGKNVGSALPLRNGKGTTYDGGQRVPMVIWGPAYIPQGKVYHKVATSMDLFPTFAKLAGSDWPAKLKIDGKDLIPLIKDPEHTKSPHEVFYYYSSHGQIQGVRRGDWKFRYAKNKKGKGRVELYNLKNDISEKKNLAKKHPEIVKELTKLMNTWDAQLTKEARPIGRLPEE